MRIASGAEALVARVRTVEGIDGFGFTLNFEAVVAREMAAWDALGRTRKLPFHALFGKKMRDQVRTVAALPGGIDPFSGDPVEDIRQRAAALPRSALVAPNGHPWEIAYCAALAGTLSGDVLICVPGEPPAGVVLVADTPGIEIDWDAEAAFGSLQWLAK